MTIDIFKWRELGEESRERLLARPVVSYAETDRVVSQILERVRDGGDDAMRELTHRFDGVQIEGLRVTESEFSEAEAEVPHQLIDALRNAVANVETFHRLQTGAAERIETVPGVQCERVSHPIESVGLYVPGGSAPLPSSVVMLAVPADIAGCPRRVLCSPPGAGGRIDPAILVAARLCGIDEVYKAGGAQAVAAMAYGTETIPRVCKIFGPGNRWVTRAKIAAAADPAGADCDLPAGPSELVVVADSSACPDHCAADLLSQAEHGEDSQVLMLTDSMALAEETERQLSKQIRTLRRRAIARTALHNGAIVLVDSVAEAIGLANRYAPEHLIVNTADPRRWLADIRNAGSVFLGPWSPETVGDYCSGTNHVLPTGGWARSRGGLGVSDFTRTMSVQQLTEAGLCAIADVARTLAEAEGLDGHANAVTIRLDRKWRIVA